MNGIQEWTIEAQNVKSLCWQGDTLIDWVGGGSEYYLDGTSKPSRVAYRYRFDAAVVSPSGTFAVIYEKRGTKGLVLKNDTTVLREINRSFYHANVYEYPVALFRRANGQEVIAHCPERYCRIDIDELETGKRLTDVPDRKPVDHFYSRLTANRTGTFLLSAGWVWHPWDTIKLYNVEAVLENPHILDGGGIVPAPSVEVSSAAFLKDDKVILASSAEQYDDEEDTSQLLPGSLAVYDVMQTRYLSQVIPENIVGTLMPVGSHLIIGFYEHPKLINLSTGQTLHQWPALNTGKQNSSIIWTIESVPPLALDPANSRFAVADKSTIHIIQIDERHFR